MSETSGPAGAATAASTTLAMTADGVCLIVTASPPWLPEVVYWGPASAAPAAAELETIATVDPAHVAVNHPDLPPRVTVLLEGRHGWQGKPGLLGSRAGRDWSPDWTTTGLRVDGAEVAGTLSSGAGLLEIDAVAAASGLSLTIAIELLPTGLVRAAASLRNDAPTEYSINEVSLGLPVPFDATELLDFAGRWGAERYAQRHPFVLGQHRREGRRGRTGADSAYVLHCGDQGFGFEQGRVWAVHTAWSGNHLHQAERDSLGYQYLSGGEVLLPGEVRLAEGATYETPWVYFACGTGLDEVASRFHRHLRALPHAPNADRPVTLNVWEAVYFDHDADRLCDLARRAAELGVERVVLDDGWFGSRRDDTSGLGDWVVSADVWPNGLHPLVDTVKDLGMEFGLWFEPEMVNLDSDVARAHPEWIMRLPDRLPIESRTQQVLNLSIDGAWQHVFDQMHAVLSEYRIDYVKWDHNRDLIDAGDAATGEAAVRDQTLAFYRLLDALREAHPGVEFESCSSGGARVDLGVLERAERIWVSDVSDPEERQRMLTWTSQLVPPEFQGSHIASRVSHTTSRSHDMNFRAATAVFGHLGLELDLAEATPEELTDLRWWIDWYKANRRVLLTGTTVRMDLPYPGCYLRGVVTAARAIFSLALLSQTGSSQSTV